MHRFTFRLQRVLEVRETTRDLCRARLAESYAAEQKLHGLRQSLERELAELVRLRQSSQIGSIDAAHLAQVQRYEAGLRADLRLLDGQIRGLEQRIDQERQALVAADRQVRLLERLRKRQLEHHRQRQASAEANELDDLVRSASGGKQHGESTGSTLWPTIDGWQLDEQV